MPGQEIFRMEGLWDWCEWMCAVMFLVEKGYTLDEVHEMNTFVDGDIVLYYTTLEEDEDEL
jgi:hypothetical protein